MVLGCGSSRDIEMPVSSFPRFICAVENRWVCPWQVLAASGQVAANSYSTWQGKIWRGAKDAMAVSGRRNEDDYKRHHTWPWPKPPRGNNTRHRPPTAPRRPPAITVGAYCLRNTRIPFLPWLSIHDILFQAKNQSSNIASTERARERGHLFVVSPPTILFAHNPQHFYSIIHHEQRGHTNKTSL